MIAFWLTEKELRQEGIIKNPVGTDRQADGRTKLAIEKLRSSINIQVTNYRFL